MVIMTTRCLSSGINSVNTWFFSPSFSLNAASRRGGPVETFRDRQSGHPRIRL